MVAINTGAEPDLVITSEYFAAVARRAAFHADLVGRFVREVGASDSTRFPAAFLLELAAVLQIGRWERQGVHEHLADDLPSYAEAAAELAARAERGAIEFAGLCSATLSSRVLNATICDLAWKAPELLGAELAIDVNEEGELIDLLAEFVWENRAELAQLTNGNR